MKVRLVLAGLLVAQLADAISFVIGVHQVGIGSEANGLARALYDAGGTAAVLAVKGATILCTIGILVVTADRFPRLLMLGGATATSLGLLGAATNTLSAALASV